ncbi:helix-turn-helix domain-containing protein [Promicromonospora iranensis]|uniref:helix-turn-helix domain-containing protein n=1 Tax=Promicromonospora iranensis TaxID=1105144 RepID=UPI0023AA014C|nr:helix-turn-helix domain-containing protein [Promicromonospora iranensis]
MAAGDHTERSLFLDHGREIAELRRRLLSQRIKAGLQAARERGDVGGRPTVVNGDRRAGILSLREQGEPIRTIARSIGISVGTVHNVLTGRSSDSKSPLSSMTKLGLARPVPRTTEIFGSGR